MSKTSREAWKAFERRVCEFFHGERRTPLSGGNSGITRGDIIHPTLYVECKLSKKSAIWTLWKDTKDKADKEEKTPVVCIREKYKKGFLIIVHSDDFLKV